MFNVKRGYSIKKALISPLILFLEVQNVKTTCRKSWPGNLFQVLNLSFDSCFKVKWGHHTKMSLFHPYYWCYDFRI